MNDHEKENTTIRAKAQSNRRNCWWRRRAADTEALLSGTGETLSGGGGGESCSVVWSKMPLRHKEAFADQGLHEAVKM